MTKHTFPNILQRTVDVTRTTPKQGIPSHQPNDEAYQELAKKLIKN